MDVSVISLSSSSVKSGCMVDLSPQAIFSTEEWRLSHEVKVEIVLERRADIPWILLYLGSN